MLELAEMVDVEVVEAMDNIDEELSNIQALIIASIIANSKDKEVEVVNADGTTSKETRSVLTSKANVDKEIRKLEKELSESFSESTLNSIKAVLAITTSYLISELNFKNKNKINAEKFFGNNVVIGDRTLSQRTAIAVSNLFVDVEKIYRKGIIAGQDVGSIAKEIEDAFSKNMYQFNNIIRSELFMAYRIQFGESVDKNGIKWIRFHESFPRHPNRKRHKCYELANKNKYGKGKGIYKPTDSNIYFPHPQCTGWLEILE